MFIGIEMMQGEMTRPVYFSSVELAREWFDVLVGEWDAVEISVELAHQRYQFLSGDVRFFADNNYGEKIVVWFVDNT
jgi:hypothetical protein